jgi:hypothetical protein
MVKTVARAKSSPQTKKPQPTADAYRKTD